MLITRFKGHHGSLLSIFGTISTSAASHDYPGVMDALQRFQRVLNEHLLEENLRLYTYLSKCLSGNEDSALLINQMRREMSEIGRTVTQFLRHYITSEVDGRNIDEFTEKLQGIGSALQDRISREENSLYTLYMPVADY